MNLRLNRNTYMIKFFKWALLVPAVVVGLETQSQAALTYGVPDTWTRNNDAVTTFAAWDVLDAGAFHPGGAPGQFGRTLDDSSPDIGASLGIGHSGINYRLYQGNGGNAGGGPGTDPTYGMTYGHRSSSGNYYSGFNTFDFMNDTITGQTRGTTGTGFSTVVLQIRSAVGNLNPDLLASITGSSTFSLVKELYEVTGTNEGIYWFEWTAAGGGLNYAINMTSDYAHVGVDSFSVDSYWTAGSSAVTSGVTAAPEPTRGLLMLLAMGAVVLRRRRAAAASVKPSGQPA